MLRHSRRAAPGQGISRADFPKKSRWVPANGQNAGNSRQSAVRILLDFSLGASVASRGERQSLQQN